MTMNTEQKIQQLEDRIAIRELIDEYAFRADTRDAQGQMAIFTEDTNFEVYMDEKLPAPTQVVKGRKNLFPVFDDLNLPPVVEGLADHHRGIIVVSGTTGSGKSTSLAAIIVKGTSEPRVCAMPIIIHDVYDVKPKD